MKPEIIETFRKIYPRKPDTHKGDYGKIFVLAGSSGMTGAACLSSFSALKSGAGLVYLGIPKSLSSVVESKLIEVIAVPLPETKQGTVAVEAFKKLKNIADGCDFLLIGPGLSRNNSTQELVRKLVLSVKKPILLDADGLNAFESKVRLLKKRKTKSLILTPHPGEFSRLLKKSVQEIEKNREKFTREFAEKFNLILVLKGYRTIVVSSEGSMYINDSGNPGIATAGSGDVLSGVIAGLRVQGLSDFEAASLGVYIHGRAGDIAANTKSEISLIASDILKSLPVVFKEIIQNI